MTANNVDTILVELKRIEGKFDAHAAKTTEDLETLKIETRKTNGRVNELELKEVARSAARQEHERMSREQSAIDSRREHRAEKWVGIAPAVIAAVVSGSTVVAISLLITGSL